MGCTGSIYDQIPVTGHATGFRVIPTSDDRYLRPQTTVLSIREKAWKSLHGDDFSIKVSNVFHNIYICTSEFYFGIIISLLILYFYSGYRWRKMVQYWRRDVINDRPKSINRPRGKRDSWL